MVFLNSISLLWQVCYDEQTLCFLNQELDLKDLGLKRKQVHSQIMCHKRAEVRNPNRFGDY
jgi:hypothetical protein